MTDVAFQRCIVPSCGATYGIHEVRVACDVCGSLLDVIYDWERLGPPESLAFFESKWSRRYEPLSLSGVWRFYELLPFAPRDRVVATCGVVKVEPNFVTAVPGSTEISIDLRALDRKVLGKMLDEAKRAATRAAKTHHVSVEWSVARYDAPLEVARLSPPRRRIRRSCSS